MRGQWEERYERRCGFRRSFVDGQVLRYLDCGLDENGFARIRCPECAAEYPLAFSCKTRELCPSCAAKRSAATAAALTEDGLSDVGEPCFDAGLFRAIRDIADEPLADADSGALLEGLIILHELRAAIAYGGYGGELSYWSTPGSKEIDFIWSKGVRRVAVEVKNSRQWRSRYAKTINEFLAAGTITRGFVVYRGDQPFRSGRVEGLPVEDVLSLFYTDTFFASR